MVPRRLSLAGGCLAAALLVAVGTFAEGSSTEGSAADGTRAERAGAERDPAQRAGAQRAGAQRAAAERSPAQPKADERSTTASGPSSNAASDSAASPAAPLSVGPLRLSAAELAARLGQASPEELRAFDRKRPAAQVAYVERVVVRELLLAAEAERVRLAEDAFVRARLRDALFQALVADERAKLEPPSDAELEAYRAEHRRDFERPERIALWRILVESEAEARAIVEAVRGAGGPERWRAQAREKSLDTATKERGGDLGFVHPDGHTDVPELRVDPALYEAARAIEDGELVVTPEGERFAVLWRRGSLRAESLSLEEARLTLQRQVTERRLEERLRALLAELAPRFVKERKDDLLELIDPASFDQR